MPGGRKRAYRASLGHWVEVEIGYVGSNQVLGSGTETKNLLTIFVKTLAKGMICIFYEIFKGLSTPGAFSNKWLTYETLRKKILKLGFNEKAFVEINRFSTEVLVIGLYQNDIGVNYGI